MNKKILISIAALALVAIAFGSIIPSTSSTSTQKNSHVSALYETMVTTQVKHNGVWGPIVDQGHNIVTNVGTNWTMCKIFGTSLPTCGGVPTVIAVGNFTGAETASLVTINNTGVYSAAGSNAPINECGLAPAAGSLTNQPLAMGNTSISYLFTTTGCAGLVVNTTALYNSTTVSGFGTTTIMWAGKNFASSVTLQTGDQLNVTWFVWITSS